MQSLKLDLVASDDNGKNKVDDGKTSKYVPAGGAQYFGFKRI